MKVSSKESVTQEFKELNILGKVLVCIIVMLLVWLVYLFFLNENILTKSAPARIIFDLQLKKIELQHLPKQQAENQSLIAVEMTVSITNPGIHKVSLLPSIWTAHGFKVKAYQWETSEFIKKATSDLNSSFKDYDLDEQRFTTDYSEKYVSTDMPLPMLVAAGRLFLDRSLSPHEKVTRKIVFHVPSSEYDLVKVIALVPTREKGGVTIEWIFDEKLNSFRPKYYHLSKNKERIEIKENARNELLAGNQVYINMSALSLW